MNVVKDSKKDYEFKKKKATFSLPIQTIEKLEKMSYKYGMNKSGLINFLINKADEEGTIL